MNPFNADKKVMTKSKIEYQDNPFSGVTNYTQFIADQIVGIGFGPASAKKIDIGDKDNMTVRSTVRYIGLKNDVKFKTKAFNGGFWVMKEKV